MAKHEITLDAIMQKEPPRRLTDEHLSDIEARLAPLLLAEARARELSREVPPAVLFAAICGARVEFDSFEVLDGFLSVRKVTNPPGIVHIARAADLDYSDYLSVGRYSLSIQAEIAVGNAATPGNKSFLVGAAWHTAALLKLRGHITLFCPSLSSVSWDTVSAFADNTVRFHMLDDVPRQIRYSREEVAISMIDAEWVRSRWNAALELRNAESSRRFGLAFNIMYVCNQTSDPRIAIACVWAGLEALFGKRDDRRTAEALARRISEWLPATAASDVRDLYTQRCDAVHGRWLNDEAVWQALRESHSLLRQALMKCIDTNTKTLVDWS